MFKLKYTTKMGDNRTKAFDAIEDVLSFIDCFRTEEEIDTFIIYNINNVYAEGRILGDIIEIKFRGDDKCQEGEKLQKY